MESAKRHKPNPIGEDVYLLYDGSIRKDEDKIIAAQRIWKERVYAPPGTYFGVRGFMYEKLCQDWIMLTQPHH